MTGFMMFVHAIICLFLVGMVLMQSGRGGGLTENFASAESMFGAKTNDMLIKITTVVATCYFATSITLAILSSQKGKSIMTDKAVSKTQPAKDESPLVKDEAANEEAVKVEIPVAASEETK